MHNENSHRSIDLTCVNPSLRYFAVSGFVMLGSFAWCGSSFTMGQQLNLTPPRHSQVQELELPPLHFNANLTAAKQAATATSRTWPIAPGMIDAIPEALEPAEAPLSAGLQEVGPGVSMISHYLKKRPQDSDLELTPPVKRESAEEASGQPEKSEPQDDSDDADLKDLLKDDPAEDEPEAQTFEAREWRLRTINEIELASQTQATRPDDRSAEILQSLSYGNAFQTPMVNQATYWVAPNLCYEPLFFEDAVLERYGKADCRYGFQPVRSGLHFTFSSILLPFRLAESRCEAETPIAFDRPGNLTPPVKEIFIPALNR